VDAAGPIVKWVGGKTKLLPELRARAPKKYGTYYEPFVGGGALFFSLAPERAVLGDMNGALIDTYRTVVSDVEPVIKRLEGHKRHHHRERYYYEVRDWWNERKWTTDEVGTAAAFIYLNKTCFNGLWRVNRDGGFNVPRGDYANPTILNAVGLRAASGVLGRARLMVNEYDATTAEAVAGDFIYFDPPYDPVSKTSNFTSYTKDMFGKKQQEQLAEHARQLRARGVQVMLSNNDTEFVRSLYQDFCVDNVKCGRSINSKGDKRGAVDEVIITSYERTS
jgi:DNA adenine methylase